MHELRDMFLPRRLAMNCGESLRGRSLVQSHCDSNWLAAGRQDDGLANPLGSGKGVRHNGDIFLRPELVAAARAQQLMEIIAGQAVERPATTCQHRRAPFYLGPWRPSAAAG